MKFYIQKDQDSPLFVGTYKQCLEEIEYRSSCKIVSENDLYIDEYHEENN